MSQVPEPQPGPLPSGSAPQYSPRGQWAWDGTAWTQVRPAAPVAYAPPPPPQQLSYPAPAQVAPAPHPAGPLPVKVTNAFAVGFFGFLGAFVASILFWVIALVVFGSCFAASLGHLSNTTSSP